ncbi:MAG: dienelactone hydrolase family protein [Bacteroidota bacterium]
MSEIDSVRRSLLASLAGLPLAALLADPALAQTAAQATRSQTLTTAGGREVTAAVARPDAEGQRRPVVLLVHEWWGLNDQIKTMALELSRQGFVAVAVDLFQGRVVTRAEEARALVEKVRAEEAEDTLAAWAAWARNHPDGNRKVGILGWCFGGGWALRAATSSPLDATVVYYGRVDLSPDRLGRLRGPVLGHFGRQDNFITAEVVSAFERGMKQAGKPYTLYWYDAGHAFANPTGDNYHQADAQLAWQRTTDFLRKELA